MIVKRRVAFVVHCEHVCFPVKQLHCKIDICLNHSQEQRCTAYVTMLQANNVRLDETNNAIIVMFERAKEQILSDVCHQQANTIDVARLNGVKEWKSTMIVSYLLVPACIEKLLNDNVFPFFSSQVKRSLPVSKLSVWIGA